jgi:hypothetical protein
MANPHTDTEQSDCLKFPESKVKDGISNYGAWAMKAKYRLIMKKLWDFIDGPSDTPPQVLTAKPLRILCRPDANRNIVEIHHNGNQVVDAAPWIEKDSQALDLIMNAILDNLLYLIKRSTSSKQAWNLLCTLLQPANSIRVYHGCG